MLRRALLPALSASKQLGASSRSRVGALAAPLRQSWCRSSLVGFSQRSFNTDGVPRSGSGTKSGDGARRPVQRNPLEPSPPSEQVYIGNLFFNVTEEDLSNHMGKFGEIKSVKVLYDARGMSKGVAFVTFDSIDAASRAVTEMNGHFFEGRPVAVQFARSTTGTASQVPEGPTNPPSRSLFIGNLSFDLTDKDLNDLFGTVDNVVDVRVAVDRRTGQPRGFAHVDFADIESAQKAADSLKGKLLFGRNLRVDFSRESFKTRGPTSEASSGSDASRGVGTPPDSATF